MQLVDQRAFPYVRHPDDHGPDCFMHPARFIFLNQIPGGVPHRVQHCLPVAFQRIQGNRPGQFPQPFLRRVGISQIGLVQKQHALFRGDHFSQFRISGGFRDSRVT